MAPTRHTDTEKIEAAAGEIENVIPSEDHARMTRRVLLKMDTR